MARQRPFSRFTRWVLVCAAVLVALPAVPALAKLPAPASGSRSATPHLDAVEQTLRRVSPGLEGSVWQRTSGNRLDAPAADPAGWLLQTPGCWGDNRCTDRSATRRLLAQLAGNIAKATSTVDISSLAPLPDGEFEDAIVTGLRTAAADRRLRVRILVGAVPLGNLDVVPALYRNRLNRRLGAAAAANITLNVASVTTSKAALSWNHSKIVVVDGRTAIVGGINAWQDAYVDTAHPVADVSMALTGPAARSAGRYLDTLWAWTCDHRWNIAAVWFTASAGAGCLPALDPAPAGPAAATGTVPVIAVGSLGVGIRRVDPLSTYRPALPTAPDTRCGISLPDRTNADRDYETVNPDESALRALIASARSRVEISQQDLNGHCPPLARYDIRLYDALAAKLAAGVKVRIVVSDPANYGPLGSGYSLIKSLAEVSDVLRNRLALITGDRETAHAAMCGNLQLASFRVAPQASWADGTPYALHNKLVAVDGAAFYLGSKNLYPAWLQDFGYIVQSRAAAAQVEANLLDPEWRYSRAAATFDHERGICPADRPG